MFRVPWVRRGDSKLMTMFAGSMICRFSTKESATHAIVAVHNTDINGQTVKCSWGKESGDPNNAQAAGQVSEQVNVIICILLYRVIQSKFADFKGLEINCSFICWSLCHRI
jgi:hypothetical protein